MNHTSKTLLFFGSGPVAAASLGSLLSSFKIEAVVTKSVPPHHKEVALVEELAKKNNLPVYFASTKRELNLLFEKQHFHSSIGLVVDYGVIMSGEVISYFKLGIINSHFSLLPKWRGADPITFSILNGDKETGVSLMRIVPTLDEGQLISQEHFALRPDITTPELTDKLVELSNSMIIRDLPRYMDGTMATYDQPNLQPSYSRKLTKKDSQLDLFKSGEVLEREVRAFRGWPKSKLSFHGKDIIVTQARVADHKTDGIFVIECGNNTFLEIQELVAPSGKTMTGAAFLRGYSS